MNKIIISVLGVLLMVSLSINVIEIKQNKDLREEIAWSMSDNLETVWTEVEVEDTNLETSDEDMNIVGESRSDGNDDIFLDNTIHVVEDTSQASITYPRPTMPEKELDSERTVEIDEPITEEKYVAPKTMTPDEEAFILISHMVEALLIEDFETSAAAITPYVHTSLLTGGVLSNSIKAFGFKKDHNDVIYYEVPVVFTRIEQISSYPLDGEEGVTYKYWIARKDDSTGMPAPVQVFFPADGSAAKIAYLGNL